MSGFSAFTVVFARPAWPASLRRQCVFPVHRAPPPFHPDCAGALAANIVPKAFRDRNRARNARS
eukprot:11200814-Lingulodinium_polyedra.AAC.1